MEYNASFIGNFILRGKFECLTGLHIGGSKEKLEIGGVDSPVIRDPRTRYPYVPGSSFKGKIRSLLEFANGAVPTSGEVSEDTDIVRLFGIGVDQKEDAKKDTTLPLFRIGPSRLIVRDSYPDMETVKWWKTLDSDLLYTEYKSENGINRITSAANPRFIERVAKGSKFEFELIYTVFNLEKPGTSLQEEVNKDLKNLRMALLLLEHNFLGKSGSRGYGRIKFGFADPVWMTTDDYKNQNGQFARSKADLPKKFEELKSIDEITWTIENLA